MEKLISSRWRNYVIGVTNDHEDNWIHSFLKGLDLCSFTFYLSEGHREDMLEGLELFPEYTFHFYYYSPEKKEVTVRVSPDFQPSIKNENGEEINFEKYFKINKQEAYELSELFIKFGNIIKKCEID